MNPQHKPQSEPVDISVSPGASLSGKPSGRLQSSETATILFGTFLLDREEFTLAVEDLREVVRYPTTVTKVPLTPDYVEGIFNLRGGIVPILNLQKLLGGDTERQVLADSRIAIVDCGQVLVGLVFDRTGEVVRVPHRSVSRIVASKDEDNPVISGVVRLDNGERVVQVISPALLVAVDAVPKFGQMHNEKKADNHVVELESAGSRRKAIAFRVDGTEFAINMEHILEIREPPEFKTTHRYFDNCLGAINLRGVLVSVLDLRKSLGGGDCVVDASKRLVVIRADDKHCGLLVDSITNVVTFRDSEVVPMPPLSDIAHRNSYRGIIPRGDSSILYLDAGEFMQQAGVMAAMAHNETVVSLDTAHKVVAGADKGRIGANSETYITFRLDDLMALRLLDVQEILNFPDSIMSPPGCAGTTIGMLNLRGRVVPIVDLRSCYNLTPFENLATTKVLIVGDGDERAGFVVDDIEAIIKTDDRNRVELPNAMKVGQKARFHGDIDSVFQFDKDGTSYNVMVFAHERALARLRNS